MQENTFWVSVWAIVASVFATLIVCLTLVSFDTNEKIEAAIKNGADPIKAFCAFNYDSKKIGLCSVAASK